MEQIFGVRTFREDGTTAEPEYRGDEKMASQYGTFRTLCVRSCDGYYFPISFSTRRDRFEEDEQACSQMCPASEVSLYFHSMPSQDSEEMVSFRTEEPYAAMPNAFSYRKAVNPDCTCGFARPIGLTEIAGGQSFRIEPIQPRQPPTPIPATRPDPGIDPRHSGQFRRAFRYRRRRSNDPPKSGAADSDARQPQCQDSRASVLSRPMTGSSAAISGPCSSPVNALRNGMNSALPLRPDFSFKAPVHSPQVVAVQGSGGKQGRGKRNEIAIFGSDFRLGAHQPLASNRRPRERG